ncbi:S-methyl-5-thioribose-1-phosphate isomerase [Sinanaerobacter sp. ZZT-01]|uniref:S-methyl-5-thioribose-1-phosphate isomerase n=1 Tax=Sinanaerobacter sp. ZZT-01 TaxID=3111540 RepID=UPI002D784292|nr:S-methyl-5-thioribose-1-phosphate isomerase [Sinanaerobacter sp. ZZT-01]WRR94567.1 S-methyl-5-thioribose-1-phosphate isomerase [Sinanaerobacter sp. ZZT-01]
MNGQKFSPIKFQDGMLLILDQTKLPTTTEYLEMHTKEDVWHAIHKLQVRGAPAIGIAAAYGSYISVKGSMEQDYEGFYTEFCMVKDYLDSARPTAVNLSWALSRMEQCVKENKSCTVEEIKGAMLKEAERIKTEEETACLAMGEYGLSLLKSGMGILTHCNAGILATSKYGTALAPLYVGQEQGYAFNVFADETRPLLQGARLTAWELNQSGIPVTLICDNMASMVMKNGWIDAVLVGCDRMAANGDGANKIGTSGVAILAKEYGIPFYMCVPTSTIDFDTPNGEEIKIELRSGDEISQMWYEKEMAPAGIQTYNPAFDVTEAKYITAVITEKGIAYPPYEESLRGLLEK